MTSETAPSSISMAHEADAASSERVFILGVGAQKAGTTWLYEYLAAAPNTATWKMKEYHVWDALHIPNFADYIVPDRPNLSEAHQLRRLMQQQPQAYFAFFDRLLEHQRKSLALDITPSYAGLNAEVFRWICAQFAVRSISTKAIFLMRDPVERCWSAARMEHRAKTGSTAIASSEVMQYVNIPGFEMRTRYDVTLSNIKAAFDSRDIFIGIYEEMFTPENVAKVSRFCGVPFRPEFIEKEVHTTEKKTDLDGATYAAIVRKFEGVYRAVASSYPQVLSLWPGFEYL